MVLAIDPERERISLGIKQLEDDPFNDYVAVNDRGTIVTGTVVEVTEKDAIIKLAEEVEGVFAPPSFPRNGWKMLGPCSRPATRLR